MKNIFIKRLLIFFLFFFAQSTFALNIDTYFSDPNSIIASTYKNGPDSFIVDSIDSSEDYIYMAMYELSLKSVTNALIEAKNRGVDVKVVTDSDHIKWKRFKDLKSSGIEIVGDGRKSIMHNKFIVIDDSVVWTGSMNLTYNGAYHNNENINKIESNNIAGCYKEEFLELFAHDNELNKKINICNQHLEDENIDIYFSPEDKFLENKLLNLINNATTKIEFLAFAFTNSKISDALKKAKDRGVIIKGVFDESQNNGYQAKYSKYDELKNYGIEVYLDANKKFPDTDKEKDYKMHDKVFIIDDKTVVFGSYNFTTAANDKNDENVLVVENKKFANVYLKEFKNIFEFAKNSYFSKKTKNEDVKKLSFPNIIISQVEYNPKKLEYSEHAYEWFSLYNPTNEIIDLSSWSVSEDISTRYFIFPQGVFMKPSQTVFVVNNKNEFLKLHSSVPEKNIIEMSGQYCADSAGCLLLNNLEDFLILKNSVPSRGYIVDFVAWENKIQNIDNKEIVWNLEVSDGESICRKNIKDTDLPSDFLAPCTSEILLFSKTINNTIHQITTTSNNSNNSDDSGTTANIVIKNSNTNINKGRGGSNPLIVKKLRELSGKFPVYKTLYDEKIEKLKKLHILQEKRKKYNKNWISY